MSTLPQRKIGSTEVSSVGAGLMSLAAYYGKPAPQSQVDEVLSRLIELGVTHIDTSDVYSSRPSLGEGEEQIGSYFSRHPEARDKFFLATKHMFTKSEAGGGLATPSKEYTFSALEASLKRLETDHVDLYYAHRPVEPIEPTVEGLKALKDAGKIKYVGVSEYTLEQLERAEKITHIDALQIEVSLWTPNIFSNGIYDWAKKNGTAIVAYSPLGRGFLTGQIKSRADFGEGDFRGYNPRFSEENFPKNLVLVDKVKAIADKAGYTPGQVALAWLLAQGDDVLPIPGSTKVKHIEENVAAATIKLSPDDLKAIDEVLASFKVSGDRYDASGVTVAF